LTATQAISAAHGGGIMGYVRSPAKDHPQFGASYAVQNLDAPPNDNHKQPD
jgi:hypothetical protein